MFQEIVINLIDIKSTLFNEFLMHISSIKLEPHFVVSLGMHGSHSLNPLPLFSFLKGESKF